MTAEAKRYPPRNDPAVEAAFEAAPPECVAEIVDGQLHVSPRPRARHANVASVLGGELHGPFRRGRGGPGGWILLDEPEIHLGPRPDKLVPDLAGWRRARLPEVPDVAAITLAPDWVCEVLSEPTEVVDRGSKMPIYAREGVGHAWLLDPVQRVLEVYRLERGALRQVAVHRGDVVVRAEPFDAVALDLGVVWSGT